MLGSFPQSDQNHKILTAPHTEESPNHRSAGTEQFVDIQNGEETRLVDEVKVAAIESHRYF